MFILLSLIMKKYSPLYFLCCSIYFGIEFNWGKKKCDPLFLVWFTCTYCHSSPESVALCLNIHISTFMYLTLDCSISIGAYTHKFSDFLFISEWCCLFIISL